MARDRNMVFSPSSIQILLGLIMAVVRSLTSLFIFSNPTLLMNSTIALLSLSILSLLMLVPVVALFCLSLTASGLTRLGTLILLARGLGKMFTRLLPFLLILRTRLVRW